MVSEDKQVVVDDGSRREVVQLGHTHEAQREVYTRTTHQDH